MKTKRKLYIVSTEPHGLELLSRYIYVFYVQKCTCYYMYN